MTAAARYIVAVRALCEFTAKQGDLDLRFSPSPSAQEGIAGHAVVASRREVTTPWPAMPSWAVGEGVKRRSRSPVLAVNSQSARTATL